ncbi:MAG: NYN domain-containing protein [Actinomycetota bacterium]|nr:NYN domain-containing protein [Actinomycetota bacterium]
MMGPHAEALLRPALELAMRVAREGEQARPRVAAPPILRPFLSFTKLPQPALDAARRAIDEDEQFRKRVLAEAEDHDVGEGGHLWLDRPEGWADRLAELEAEVASRAEREENERHERTAQKRLDAAETAKRRAEERAGSLAAEAEDARAELAAIRQARSELAAQLEAAQADARRLEEERREAVRQLEDTRRAYADRVAEVRGLQEELSEVRSALDATREELARAADEPASKAEKRPAPRRRRDGAAPAPPPVAAEVASAVVRASGAAEDLARALAEAAAALQVPAPLPVKRADGPVRRQRRPVRMPPGVFDDSIEAAEHLVRLDEVLVLIDGYNVTKEGWPELALNDQRKRLVDALVDLRARTGSDVEVVFDGADHDGGGLGARSAPERVRVRFSPSHIEADDLVLELVDAAPVERPVVVVSSDNRVRTGARRRGANTLATWQLLAILR